MGMFLSKYRMLRSLVSDDEPYIRKNDTKEKLKKFKLIGFIIHDPILHKDFHEQLNRNFDRLDYLTGPDFLFFTIIETKLLAIKRKCSIYPKHLDNL